MNKAQISTWLLTLLLGLNSCDRSTNSEIAPQAVIMKPEERVDAYIRDWHKCWLKQGNGVPPSIERMRNMDFFTQWEQDISKLDAAHWTGISGSASNFSIPPEHDPDTEKIVKVSVNDDAASIETEHASGSLTKFTEYSLVREKETWKISSAVVFYDEENATAFSVAEVDAWLAKTSLKPQLPLPKAGDSPNCELLFKAGHVFKGDAMIGPAKVEVRKAGKISLPSGAIVVRDFGYDLEDAMPLSLKVEPGEYQVDVAILENTIAAVRIMLEPGGREPFEYRRAVVVEGDGSVIGVDAGNVCLGDARAFMSRTKRGHMRDYDMWAKAAMRIAKSDDVSFLKLNGSSSANAVVVGSGHGDGGYPAYWMLDADGKPVALVVDFLIAAEFPTRKAHLPWKAGVSGVLLDESKPDGPKVRISAEDGVVVSGVSVKNIRWLDPKGTVVGDNSSVGSWSSGEENGWNVDLKKLDGLAEQMEVEYYFGYRNGP